MIKKKPKPAPEVTGEVYLAAATGNTPLISQLIKKDKTILDTDENGFCGLHFACSNGKVSTVLYFIENCADVNARTNTGITPLMCAAHNGHEEIVDILLEVADIDVFAETEDGEIAADFAHMGMHASIAVKLDALARDRWTVEDVHSACSQGDVLHLKYCLNNKGVDSNSRDTNGDTLLMLAVKSTITDTSPIVRFLLKQPLIDVNLTDNSGDTALMLCCKNTEVPDTKNLELLMQHPKLKCNQVNPDSGLTAFMYCVMRNRINYLDCLINTKQLDLLMNNKTNAGESVEDLCAKGENKTLFAHLQNTVKYKSQLKPSEENGDGDDESDEGEETQSKESSAKKSRTETPASSN